MKLTKEEEKIYITNEEEKRKIFEMKFVQDEFVMIFYQSGPVLISEQLDKKAYEEFDKLLNNKYEFGDKNSTQTKNKIVWMSDMSNYSIDKENLKDINRLIIKWEKSGITLEPINLYFKQMRINKQFNVIMFRNKENGEFSRNKETGSRFQDDVMDAFENILRKDKVRTR